MKCILLLVVGICSQIANAQQAIPALPILNKYQKTRDFTVNTKQTEAYFTVQSPNEEISGIFKSIKKDGKWQEATLASFSGISKDLEPHLSPNGLRLYFASNRSSDFSSEVTKNFDIWYVERSSTADKWREPINAGKTINTVHNEFYPAVTQNNNLYFTSDRPTAIGKDDIFFSKWNKGIYTEPISLNKNVNTEGYEFNSYIAPDESFLLFSGYGRKDGVGSGDLYISYKGKEGIWSEAKNLGKLINSKYMDYCPFVHWSTKTLYFTSKRSNVVSKKKHDTSSFLNEVNRYDNGLSKIYKLDISGILAH